MIFGHLLHHSLVEFPEQATLVEKLNSQSKRLVAVSALYTLSQSLSAIFVVIYLFKVNGDISKPLMFYLGIYVGITIGFLIGGELLKRIKLGVLLSLGFIISMLFFVALVILGESSAKYVFVLGLFCGVGEGFYWLARHVLEYISAKDLNRNRLFASMFIVNTIGAVLGPVLAGFLIISGEAQNFPGYLFVFATSGILFLIASFVALKFKVSQIFDYQVKDLLTLDQNNKSWRAVEWGDFVHGLRMGAGQVLIGLVVFFILKNEFDVGSVTTLGAALSLVVGFAIGKFSNNKQRYTLAIWSSFIAVLAYVILTIWFNVTGLFVYVMLMGLSAPALYISLTSVNNKAIDEGSNLSISKVITYKVSNEIWWNVGRIISVLVFLLTLRFMDLYEATKFFLLVSVIVFPLMVIIYKHYKLFDVRY